MSDLRESGGSVKTGFGNLFNRLSNRGKNEPIRDSDDTRSTAAAIDVRKYYRVYVI